MEYKGYKMKIKIKATTVTELLQTDKSDDGVIRRKDGSMEKINKIYPKEQKVLALTKSGHEQIVKTPIYSGNGFRGLLRRKALQILIEKGIEKGFSFDNAIDFHLNNAGGGNNFQSQLFKIEDTVREENPLISLFGASLAIKGKLVTPNLIPFKSVLSDGDGSVKEYYVAENEEGVLYSTIKDYEVFHKVDDMLDRNGNAKYLSPTLMESWVMDVQENQKGVANSRNEENKNEKKVKKETIKSRLARDFIVRGVNLYTALSPMPQTTLTEVEKGLLYSALELAVFEQLGSNKAKGFGFMNYEISFSDGSSLVVEVDEYLTPKVIKKEYKEEVKKAKLAFEKWLEDDFSQKTFEVSKVMK